MKMGIVWVIFIFIGTAFSVTSCKRSSNSETKNALQRVFCNTTYRDIKLHPDVHPDLLLNWDRKLMEYEANKLRHEVDKMNISELIDKHSEIRNRRNDLKVAFRKSDRGSYDIDDMVNLRHYDRVENILLKRGEILCGNDHGEKEVGNSGPTPTTESAQAGASIRGKVGDKCDTNSSCFSNCCASTDLTTTKKTCLIESRCTENVQFGTSKGDIGDICDTNSSCFSNCCTFSYPTTSTQKKCFTESKCN